MMKLKSDFCYSNPWGRGSPRRHCPGYYGKSYKPAYCDKCCYCEKVTPKEFPYIILGLRGTPKPSFEQFVEMERLSQKLSRTQFFDIFGVADQENLEWLRG